MILRRLKLGMVLWIIFIAGTTANAQFKKPHLLIGANILYANPKGSFSNGYNFGIGGELSGGIGFGKTYVVATYGNAIFFANNENPYGNLTMKPLKIGIKHYLLANKIFVKGDLGIGYAKDKSTDTRKNVFMRGIGAGVRLLGLEAGLYYDGWKSLHVNGYSNNVIVKVGWNKIF